MDIFLGESPDKRGKYCDFYKNGEYVYIKVKRENLLLLGGESKIDFAYTGNIPHEISKTLREGGFVSAGIIFLDLSEMNTSEINVGDISHLILLSAVFKSAPNRKKELFLIIEDEQLRDFFNVEFRKEKMRIIDVSAFAVPPLNEGENNLVAMRRKARPNLLVISEKGDPRNQEPEVQQTNGSPQKKEIFFFRSA